MKAVAPIILPDWLRATIPGRLKPSLRRFLCFVVDVVDRVCGRFDGLTPPALLRVRVGCFASFLRMGRYRAVGQEFADHLRLIAGLEPQHHMLDIGCGCGQVAAAVIPVLGPHGRYDGFDPDVQAIDWCRRHIAARYANFHFSHADVANTQYNPCGTVSAVHVRLPYEDASFDIILLKSVFTHMQRPQLEHYLNEIARLLRPGGRCLATFFLLDEAVQRKMQIDRTAFNFRHVGDGCRLVDPVIPDYLVAYERAVLHEAIAKAGLRLARPIDEGTWAGHKDALSFQDMVLLTRDQPGDESSS